MSTNWSNTMGTKGKTWIAKKTVSKSFKAAVALRQQLIQDAMAHIHSGKQLIIENEEHNVMLRRNSNNGLVQDFIEDIRELDELISKLSKYL